MGDPARTTPVTDSGSAPEVDEPAILEACLDPAVPLTRVSFTQFHPARVDCPWGLQGNLTPRQWHNQARVVERETHLLPEGATICGLRITSEESTFLYDDAVALLFEDVVLVSGGPGTPLDQFPVRDGLPRYDWPAIVGTEMADSAAPYLCLGGRTSQCQVPQTEVIGQFALDFAPEVMASLAARVAPPDGFSLSLVSIGDNDPQDCAHTDLTLQVDLDLRLP